MAYRVERIERLFAAGKAAEISGVSQPLQRDWRRRGLLPANTTGRHTRFSPLDLLQLRIMLAFSQGGIGVKGASSLAMACAIPAEMFLMNLPGAVAFEGVNLTPEERARLLAAEAPMPESEFFFSPLPESGERGEAETDLADGYMLAGPEELLARVPRGPWFYGLVFDFKSLAGAVHAAAPLPLYTYKITEEAAE